MKDLHDDDYNPVKNWRDGHDPVKHGHGDAINEGFGEG